MAPTPKRHTIEIENPLQTFDKSLERQFEFWNTVFRLDSSKAILYHSDSQRIEDTVEAIHGRKREDYLDSLHQARTAEDETFKLFTGMKQHMRDNVSRAYETGYLQQLLDTLKANDLGTYHAGLIMIESGFNKDAVSKFGAGGIAQFMPTIAREYGLKVNEEVDERLDVAKSFHAFATYMKKAHERFPNPAIAMISYNTGMYHDYLNEYHNGEKTVVETIKEMGFAPQQYIPTISIANEMLNNPSEYYPSIEITKSNEASH